MPRFIYISKIDEDHSDYNATFDALRERFGNKIAPVVVPTLDENKKVTGLMDILNKRAYEMQGGRRVGSSCLRKRWLSSTSSTMR